MAEEAFEKHDLPSGAWVAFRDPKQLTRKQRKPIDRAHTRLGLAVNVHRALAGESSPGDLSDADVDLFEAVMNAVALVLIESWSFVGEASIEAIENLHDDDYEALILAARAHRPTLLPSFDPGPREDGDGNENPTGLSPESKIISEGETPQGSSLTTSFEPGIS